MIQDLAARRLDGLALVLVSSDSEPPNGAERVASALLNGLVSHRHKALAADALARPLYERALAICEKTLGPDYPDTAKTLNNLARLLQAQGDLAAPRPLYERALAICEKALGLDHPDTVTMRNNFAHLV